MEIALLAKKPQYVTDVARIIHEKFEMDTLKKGKFRDTVKFFGRSGVKAYPITMIALESGRCIGTVSVFENDIPENKTYNPWLAALYVSPEYRGRGIANKLIEKMLFHINEIGFETIYTKTDSDMRYNYYLKKGWELIETIQIDGRDTYIFKKGME